MKGAPVLILFMALILTSCRPTEQQRYYLTRIDSLQSVLDSAENQYMTLDTARLKTSIGIIKNDLERLMHMDTLWSDTVKIYAMIGKTLQKLSDQRVKIMDDLTYTRNQLVTLENDTRKGRLADSLVATYYKEEAKATGQLADKMWFNRQSIDYQLESFAYLEQKIKRMAGDRK